jgi:hypothetical protein
MRMAEVKEKAKQLGIKPGRMRKAELIRAIQKAEGNIPCFQTDVDACGETGCCWRDDCQGEPGVPNAVKEFVSSLT